MHGVAKEPGGAALVTGERVRIEGERALDHGDAGIDEDAGDQRLFDERNSRLVDTRADVLPCY